MVCSSPAPRVEFSSIEVYMQQCPKAEEMRTSFPPIFPFPSLYHYPERKNGVVGFLAEKRLSVACTENG